MLLHGHKHVEKNLHMKKNICGAKSHLQQKQECVSC